MYSLYVIKNTEAIYMNLCKCSLRWVLERKYKLYKKIYKIAWERARCCMCVNKRRGEMRTKRYRDMEIDRERDIESGVEKEMR